MRARRILRAASVRGGEPIAAFPCPAPRVSTFGDAPAPAVGEASLTPPHRLHAEN
ncbi:hypothetical protein SAMN06265174_102603 [Dietzia kunjamensis subsp. schimae]|uniref:Uncharacterized protein n=1 Tax=Dietzia kunjamensis subsp. schimae TaxID=498198 RepID=A0ABY1N0E6_9ACTN|nr:hypothetical protein SAMN06265174_102603 [Dietzia kunjamensis subsp. schimae]